jgi:hypothetical protein
MILEKMTISTKLFQKELMKARRMLSPNEEFELEVWVMKNYSDLIDKNNLRYIKA